MSHGNAPLVAILSLLAGVVPTVIYALIVYALDRHEREPIRLLGAAFVWGAAPAVILSLASAWAVAAPLSMAPEDLRASLFTFLVAPPTEELFKALALLAVFLLRRHEFDGALDGIVYGSMIGFGFGMTENVLYYLGAYAEGGLAAWGGVVLARSAVGLNHAMYTSLTGVGLGVARYRRGWRAAGYVALGLGAAVGAHLLHNVLISSASTCLVGLLVDWAGAAVVLAIVVLSWRRERGYLKEQLVEEVALGTLTPTQYERIAVRRRRLWQEWALRGAGANRQARLWRELTDTAVDLAFKKHQHAALGDERGNGQRIERLRRRILTLRQALGEGSAGEMGANGVAAGWREE